MLNVTPSEKQHDKHQPLPKKSVALGEPVRPGTPFFESALAFRAAMEKLGITQTEAVRELVLSTLPPLTRAVRAARAGARVEFVTTVVVTHLDGRVESFEARRRTMPRARRARKSHA